MLEKKGTDYKVYLESEPESELRSELENFLSEFSFRARVQIFPFEVQIILRVWFLNIKFRFFMRFRFWDKLG